MACPYCNPPPTFAFPFTPPTSAPKTKKTSLKRMIKDMKDNLEVWNEMIKQEEDAKKKKNEKPKTFKIDLNPLAIIMLAAAPFVGIGTSFWFLHTFKEVIPLVIK